MQQKTDNRQQFSEHSSLRKFFRNVVLPVEKIRKIIVNVLSGIEINSILDFGSGTLFWTEWFLNKFKSKMYAVDKYYTGKQF